MGDMNYIDHILFGLRWLDPIDYNENIKNSPKERLRSWFMDTFDLGEFGQLGKIQSNNSNEHDLADLLNDGNFTDEEGDILNDFKAQQEPQQPPPNIKKRKINFLD